MSYSFYYCENNASVLYFGREIHKDAVKPNTCDALTDSDISTDNTKIVIWISMRESLASGEFA